MDLPTRDQALALATAPGQPHELVPLEIRGRVQRVFAHAPPHLRAMFEASASDALFLVYGDERMTYAQAWAAASRIGHVLVHRCGVKPGDRVAIAMRNYPEWVLAFMAITSIGALAVAMNAHWQGEEMAFGLQDTGASVLLADPERVARLAQVPALPGLKVLTVRETEPMPGTQPLAAWMDGLGDVPMPDVPLAPDDAASILFTSGSTGHPKGVVSSHRNILSALLSWELDRRVGELMAGIDPSAATDPGGTLLAVPLFHVTGLHASCLASFRLQRSLVCMYRWDAEEAARLIDREKLTTVVAPAALTGDLVRLAQEGRYSLATLQYVGGGGAPRAPEQVRQIGSSFPAALPNTGWGMTETNAIGAGIGGEDYLARPASSGRCSQVLELQVVDETGQPLPAGQRGELRVRGTSLFIEYWNRPEVNVRVFEDGWFRTGDVAMIDAEGYVFIVDRIKDLIIRGGENIGCGQVEAALLMHPLVREAAVYGVPDERLGEEVGATVYVSQPLSAQDLREFLAAHLARFEIPRYIEVSTEPLPRIATGKISKRAIAAAAIPGFLA